MSDDRKGNRVNKGKIIEGLIIALVVLMSIIAIFYGAGGTGLFQPEALSSAKALSSEQVDFSLSEELVCDGTTLSGKVMITNNGETIRNLSSGAMPVNLGVSIVDQDHQCIDPDYAHLAITESAFEQGATIAVDIRLENISEIGQGNGLRFEIVQEGVGWFDKTALYYYPEIPAARYELGTMLSFDVNSPTANPYCVSGFSHNEEGYTWTEGNTSIMRFALATTQADLKVTFECGLYGEKQNVGISVNDTPLTRLSIEQDGKQAFVIPNAMLAGGELELRFDFPDAVSPKQAGENGDERLLALKFVKMVIQEEGESAT